MINNTLWYNKLQLTKEQRLQLLYDAKILNKDGSYHPDFFSDETVRKSREKKQGS